jgi:predicted ester cyclase
LTRVGLGDIYQAYIARLNKQDWPDLGRFVHDDIHYNGKRIGLSGYREMLEGDFRAIPDLYFDTQMLVVEPPRIASRFALRLHAQRIAVWSPGQRQERPVCRECLLRISGRTD